ncbi:MAG: hypothetical protein PHW04_13765 [Candidatus Wallbacteria bacterium]|nr:hypothetical protein [Candidatus Wallbacteria bacterium]
MSKNVLLILIGKRKDTAINVQKVLTAWGCMIKTRLGIHDGVLDHCSDTGLLMLEMVGEHDKLAELEAKLNILPNVKAQLVTLTLN